MNTPFSHANTGKALDWSPTSHLDNGTEKDSWVTSYMDILTLMLTLFVILLAYQMHANSAQDSQQANQTKQQASSAPQTAAATASPSTDPETIHVERVQPTAVAALAEYSELAPPARDDVPVSDAAIISDAAAETDVALMPTEQPTSPPEQLTEAQYSTLDVSAVEAALHTALGASIPPVEILPNGFSIALNEQVLFAPGSASVSIQGGDILRSIAPALAEFDGEIFIEGHTDNRPITTAHFPSNWELSTHRATSVTRLLIEFGLPPARMRAVGFGDTQPVADNQTPQGRAANRRVSVVVRLPAAQE